MFSDFYGKIEDRRRRGRQIGWHHWLNGHEFEQTPGDWRTGKPGGLLSMWSERAGHDLVTEQQQQSCVFIKFEGSFRLKEYCLVTFICMSKYAYVWLSMYFFPVSFYEGLKLFLKKKLETSEIKWEIIYQEPEMIAGEGNGTPLQYSCLENPMDEGAWWAAVHGVAKSRTRLSDFPFTFHLHALEKEMAPLQCSCQENPRDGGAWWAAIYGVAQSQTRLKRLSSSSRDDILLNVLGGTFLDSPCSPLHFPRLDEMLFLWALRLSYVYLSHRNGPFLIQYLPMAFWKADCTLELWIIRTLHGPWHVIGAPYMFIE